MKYFKPLGGGGGGDYVPKIPERSEKALKTRTLSHDWSKPSCGQMRLANGHMNDILKKGIEIS